MIEVYINENGIACIPLKDYNDSLEEIERLNKALLDIKETLKDYGERQDIVDYTMYYISGEQLITIIDIVNKALGSDKE